MFWYPADLQKQKPSISLRIAGGFSAAAEPCFLFVHATQNLSTSYKT